MTDKQKLHGRIKSGVRKDCYSRIAFAAARGEAMEIFRRLPFVAVVGSVVKQRYSDNAIYSGNSVEGCVYKKVHDRQTKAKKNLDPTPTPRAK